MANFKNKYSVIAALMLVAIPVLSGSGEYLIYIINGNDSKTALTIEIADDESERQRGLMYRYSLDRDRGMLFVFEKERMLSFWMKNTYIPLDIAYISKTGVINEIYRMEPLDISITYPSKKAAMYALEVNAGWFSRNSITAGMKLDFNGCLGK